MPTSPKPPKRRKESLRKKKSQRKKLQKRSRKEKKTNERIGQAGTETGTAVGTKRKTGETGIVGTGTDPATTKDQKATASQDPRKVKDQARARARAKERRDLLRRNPDKLLGGAERNQEDSRVLQEQQVQ